MFGEDTLTSSWSPIGKRRSIFFDSCNWGSWEEKKKSSSTRGVRSTSAATRTNSRTVAPRVHQTARGCALVRPARREGHVFFIGSGRPRSACHSWAAADWFSRRSDGACPIEISYMGRIAIECDLRIVPYGFGRPQRRNELLAGENPAEGFHLSEPGEHPVRPVTP